MMASSVTQGRLATEAREVLKAAEGAGLGLRLLGGLAVGLRCPSFDEEPFSREVGDMDFAAMGHSRKVEDFFAGLGYTPDAEFNMYNGESRLLFKSPSGTKVDVFVSSFSMCHVLPFEGRLERDSVSLPLAELLATKLQVVEANAKDLSDAACILADHAFGDGDGESINALRLGELCGKDWGLYRTLGLSVAKLASWALNAPFAEASRRDLVLARAGELGAIVESCPKSARWRMRAAVGDRVRWYEVVEEAER